MTMLNPNTCTPRDLLALPGVTQDQANKIIAGRPYVTLADLRKWVWINDTAMGQLAIPAVAKAAPTPAPAPVPQPPKPVQPAPQPVPAPTPAQPQNLPARLAGVKAGETVNLTGQWVQDSPITIAPDGVTITGDATILCKSGIKDAAGHDVSTAIAVQGDNFTCTGLRFISDKPLATAGPEKVGITVFRVTGKNAKIARCSAQDVDTLVFLEQSASGASITDCPGLEGDRSIRGDYIYVGGAPNFTITNCGGFGSQKEHWIRVEVSSSGNANTASGTITGGSYGNFNGKESIAIRYAAEVTLDDLDATGSRIRAGQVDPNGPTQRSVGKLTINNVRLHNRADLQISQGVLDCTINLTADNYNGYCPVHVNGPNVCVRGAVTLIDKEPTASHDKVMKFGTFGPNDVVDVK